MHGEETFAYCDQIDARPGAEIGLYVSTDADLIDVELVRPHAIGDTERIHHSYERVPDFPVQTLRGARQATYTGSFGIVPGVDLDTTAVTLGAYIWPTALRDVTQGILALSDRTQTLSLGLNAEGCLTAQVQGQDIYTVITGGEPLALREWYFVAIAVDAADGVMTVHQVPVRPTAPGHGPSSTAGHASSALSRITADRLLIATDSLVTAPDGQPRAERTFDGKIDGPVVFTRCLEAGEVSSLVESRADPAGGCNRWSFSGSFETDAFGSGDTGEFPGRLYNAPTRAVTGHNWTGEEVDFRRVPEQYGAAHFHSDDVEDCAWQRTATITLPAELTSGIYCILVSGRESRDHVPIFVRPASRSASDVAFLAPTFSYLAYANSRLSEEMDFDGVLTPRELKFSERDRQIFAHREFGMSLYDHHTDGSGACYSSHLRPVLNMRWDFESAVQGAPRHFAADLLLPEWLDTLGIHHEVISDHALHAEGSDLLAGYKVLLTGSHPEYWSGYMLDALERFLAEGGSLLYVGGNGFYWVTAADRARPHLIEVRRGQQGIRTWEGQPGEGYMSQSSEAGGLWRLRGRAPNRLVGVGMAAQGWDNATPGFVRTEAANDPRASFLFAGIPEGEVIGDFGLVLGGAAGDEVDRADVALGTPRHALVVARSQPHSEYYLAAPEEISTPTPCINGTNNSNVRADMTFFETPAGGAVLSTSAITWTGSLAYNRFHNNVARLTENAIRRFLDDEPAAVQTDPVSACASADDSSGDGRRPSPLALSQQGGEAGAA
jgi:N,N-dimethylformamidase